MRRRRRRVGDRGGRKGREGGLENEEREEGTALLSPPAGISFIPSLPRVRPKENSKGKKREEKERFEK